MWGVSQLSMKLFTLKSGLLRIFCFFALLALAILQFRLAMFEQSEFSRKTDLSSSHKYQSNPYLLSWLAKQKHIFEADLFAANSLYQQALTVNSLFLPAWLGLAELKLDQQQSQQANAILDYSSVLATDIKRWRWDKALVAFQFDRKDILAADLSFIISNMKGKVRNDALRMAFSVWPDTMELEDRMGSDNLIHLFRYATAKKKVEEGLALWRTLRFQGIQELEKETLAFINMLLSVGEIKTAAEIWKKHFNSNNYMYNGDFKEKPLQTAFGWRIGKNKGVSWKLQEEDKKGEPARLHLHFSRKKNIHLRNIYQIVPLPGGKVYALRAKIKTAKVTTDQRPYLEVYGYKCKIPYKKSEMVDSDQEWRDQYLFFNVPEESDAVIVRLRRRESTYIDNKLAGDIWLTDFEIAVTGENFTILDEQ